MSSTSPTQPCHGADAVDSPGRVFAISSKFDIKRLRICRDSSNEVSPQRRLGSRPTITRTGTAGPGRPTRQLVWVSEIIKSVWDLTVDSYPASRSRRARRRHGFWKTKGLATYGSSSGSTAHGAEKKLFENQYEDIKREKRGQLHTYVVELMLSAFPARSHPGMSNRVYMTSNKHAGRLVRYRARFREGARHMGWWVYRRPQADIALVRARLTR